MDLARIKENVAKMALMNAPEADIDGYIASEGVTVDDVRNFDMPLPEAKGFLGRTADDLRQRGAKLADIMSADQQGLQTRPESLFQGAMNEVGAVGDVVGQGVVSGAKTAFGALPEDWQQKISDTGSQVMQSPVGQLVSKGAQAYNENLEAYNKANPRAGRNFEAIRTAGAAFMPVGGKSVAGAVTDASLDTVKGAFKVANRLKPSPTYTADEIKDISRASYALAEAQGANLRPDFTNTLIQGAKAVLPTNPFERIGRGRTVSDSFVKDLESFRGKPMTLADAEALDKNLTDKIADTWDINRRGYSVEGRELQKIQDKLREMIENPDSKHINGGKEGLDTYRKAVKEWAAARRMDDIEDIFKRAEMTDNPATSIKTGFRNLAMNPKRMRGYTAKERKLIENAAKSNLGIDALRTLGSRLVPLIVGSSGGGLGVTGLAHASSVSSRGLAASLQAKKGAKVAKEISKRIAMPKTPSKASSVNTGKIIQEILLLPAPAASINGNTAGTSLYGQELEKALLKSKK